MAKLSKRKANESYPQYVKRIFPNWSSEQRALVCDIIKAAWFDGLRYERDINNQIKSNKQK